MLLDADGTMSRKLKKNRKRERGTKDKEEEQDDFSARNII